MTDINAPQAGAIAAVEQTAEAVRVPQAVGMVAYNIPAQALAASFGGVSVAYRNISGTIDVQQAYVLAAVLGNVFNPRLRAWTFDLDGHEFYVLNLGNGKTLLLDTLTEKWSWWSSGNLDRWRVQCGTSWTQSGQVALNGGSDIVVGDDSTGILWTLDPDQAYDDPLYGGDREAGVQRAFPRAVTGQVTTRGRNFIPCYEVFLTCVPGTPGLVGAEVTLFYSDDGGRSYVSAGTIAAQQDNYQQEFVWWSLGQIGAPGRMFRIEDNGALRQIYDLSIADVQ